MTNAETLRRNRELYDDVDGPEWRLAVYEPMFAGARYINLGGEALVERLAELLAARAAGPIFDLGCGTGDFAVRLAALTGAHITGVEINPRQAERARASAGTCRRGSLTVVEADAAAWRPGRVFGAGYSIDTLMLVPDVPVFLSAARGAIGEDGCFVASLILGSRLSDEERRYFCSQDGFVSLSTREQATANLAGAGFRKVEWEIRQEWALHGLARSLAGLRASRHAIADAIGEAGWQNWRDVGAAYLDCFQSDKLHYAIVTARAAG